MGPSGDLHLAQTPKVGQGLGNGGRTSASFWVFTQASRGVAGLRAGQGSDEAYYWHRAGGLWSLPSNGLRLTRVASSQVKVASPTSENGLVKAPDQHTHEWSFGILFKIPKSRDNERMWDSWDVVLTLWDLWFCSFECSAPCKIYKCIIFHHIVFLLLIQWVRQLIEFMPALKNLNSMKENNKHVPKQSCKGEEMQ